MPSVAREILKTLWKIDFQKYKVLKKNVPPPAPYSFHKFALFFSNSKIVNTRALQRAKYVVHASPLLSCKINLKQK